jgi:PKD repeat protein
MVLIFVILSGFLSGACAATTRIDSIIDTIGPVYEKQRIFSNNPANGFLYDSSLISNGGSIQEVKNTLYQSGQLDTTTVLTYDSEGRGHMVASEMLRYLTQPAANGTETDPSCVFTTSDATTLLGYTDANAPSSYTRGIVSSSIATGDALAYQSTGSVSAEGLSYQMEVQPPNGQESMNARVATASAYAVDSRTEETRVHESLVTSGSIGLVSESYQIGDRYDASHQLMSEGAVIERVVVSDFHLSGGEIRPVTDQLVYTAGTTVGKGDFNEVRLLTLDESIETTRVISYDQEDTSGGIIVTEFVRAERAGGVGADNAAEPDCVFSDSDLVSDISGVQSSAVAHASSQFIGVASAMSETMTQVTFGAEAENGLSLVYDSHISAPADLRSEFELYVHDLDGDGLYEDLNGNGRLDFADLIVLFDNMSWLLEDERGSLFDFNQNGVLDYADITALFDMIQMGDDEK